MCSAMLLPNPRGCIKLSTRQSKAAKKRPLVIALFIIGLTIVLSACGGGGSSSTPANQHTSDPVVVNPPTPDPAPQPTPQLPSEPADEIPFSLSQVVPFDYQQRTQGRAIAANQVQGASFTNISGHFIYPTANAQLQGNLTVSVTVNDPDGIANVFLGFVGSEQAITFCSQNCGVAFHRTITGINPLALGLTNTDNSNNSQTLQLWSDDNQGNRTIINQQTITWRPVNITGSTINRSTGNIHLQWQKNSNYLRYNLYLATDPNLSVSNYRQMPLAAQQLSLTDSQFDLTGLADETVFYVLIVGVDGGGESAFSGTLPIAPLSGPIPEPPVPVNLPPQANNDQFSLNEDETFTGNLLANDNDPDNDALTVNTTPIVNVENGSLTIDSVGNFSYTPPLDFFGVEQFSYQISDGRGGVAQANVQLTVVAQNDQPVVFDNNYNLTNNEEPLTIAAPGLLANDFDIDVETLEVDTEVVTEPNNGDLTLHSDGSFVYIANSGFNGTDQFTYRVHDAQGAQATGTTVITVGSTNNPPIASNDVYNTIKNVPLNTNSAGLASILANDSDLDGDTLSLVGDLILPNHGTLVVSSDGHFNYLPQPNFFGVDHFIYTITDGNSDDNGTLNRATASVTIVVIGQNQAPSAVADQYQLDEDTALDISAATGLLSNDSDNDGDTLRASLISSTSNGRLTVNANGAFQYTPTANFSGTDSFIYQVSDHLGASAQAVVSLLVNPINDLPIANNDTAVTNINTPVTIDVLANDSDIESTSLTIIAASATNGSSQIVNQRIVYQPNPGFAGSDSINYQISDSDNGLANGIVTVTVIDNRQSPIANNDSYTLLEDTSLVISASEGLLLNDSDPNNDPITVNTTPVSTPSQGSVSLASDGSFVYLANPNFFGSDSFSYQIDDGNGGQATAVVNLTVVPVNDAPVAVNDSISVNSNEITFINVLDNDFDVDGDDIVVSHASNSSGGIVVQNDTTLVYQPAAGTHTSDTINYRISDGHGGSASAQVSVSINRINQPPIAVADNATTAEDTTVVIAVLTNDSDPDNDTLTIEGVSLADGDASATINSDNTLSFTPSSNFNGTTSLIYTISDNHGGSASATVNITVTPVNDNPQAVADTSEVAEDTSVTIAVLANDTDVDGDELTITSATASHGVVTITSEQTLIFIGESNFHGSTLINYTISDGHGGTASSEVALTVTPVNDPPTVNDNSATIAESAPNGTVILTVTASDIDEPETLSFFITTGNNDGIFAIDSHTGILTVANSDLLDFATAQRHQLTITVTDSGGLTGAAEVIIEVLRDPKNEVPVADPGFGNGSLRGVPGVSASNAFALGYNDSPADFTQDHAGRFIMVGNVTPPDNDNRISINRYLANGQLDQRFGALGLFGINLLQAEVVNAVTVDSNDNIYVAGSQFNGSSTEIFIAKLTASGQIDLSFGFAGITSTAMGQSNVQVADILVHANGSILVGASVNNEWRVLAFDQSGIVNNGIIVNLPGEFDHLSALTEQADGKVIAVGYVANPAANFTYDFATIRFNSNPGFSLDNTFGNQGMSIVDLGTSNHDMANAVALQSNGDIIIVGQHNNGSVSEDVAVIALDPNGTLKTSFANNGIAIIDADGDQGDLTNNSTAVAVAIDNADNLYIATKFGISDIDFGVVKTTANGLLDSSFGHNGIVSHDINQSHNEPVNLVLDNDNQPVIGASAQGTSAPGLSNHDFAIARFTSAGVIDERFARGGLNTTNQTLSQDHVFAMIQTHVAPYQNHFVMVGYTKSAAQTDIALVARYTPEGHLDTSFGNNGYFNLASTHPNDHHYAFAVAELKDGRLAVVGFINTEDSYLLMLDSSGHPDSQFTDTGLLALHSDGGILDIQTIAITQNDKIVLAGNEQSETTSKGYIARLNLDGSFDTSFNDTGFVLTDLAEPSRLHRIALLNDNSIVAVGTKGTNALISKYTANGTLDTGFNNQGWQIFDFTPPPGPNNPDGESSFDFLQDVEINSQGQIFANGGTNYLGNQRLILVSVNADGSPNNLFAGNGSAIYDFGFGNAPASLAFDRQEKLVLTGTTNSATEGQDIFIARVEPNGQLDPLFNNGHPVLFDYGSADVAQSVMVLADGRILISGHTALERIPGTVWYLFMTKLTAVEPPPPPP